VLRHEQRNLVGWHRIGDYDQTDAMTEAKRFFERIVLLPLRQGVVLSMKMPNVLIVLNAVIFKGDPKLLAMPI
jgi:hypothetical protein